MFSLPSVLSFVHLIGLAWGLGAATTKLALLLRCRADRSFVPVYLGVARPITRFIVLGLILLTLSGLGWLVAGYAVTPHLALKLVLVAILWLLGPLIDKVLEPRFRHLASATDPSVSETFLGAQRRYLLVEGLATTLFYVIVAMWLLF